MGDHSPANKTRETEYARLTVKMDLSHDEAIAVLDAADVITAVPGAKLALEVMKALGSPSKSLELVERLSTRPAYTKWARQQLRRAGVTWDISGDWNKQLKAAKALLEMRCVAVSAV